MTLRLLWLSNLANLCQIRKLVVQILDYKKINAPKLHMKIANTEKGLDEAISQGRRCLRPSVSLCEATGSRHGQVVNPPQAWGSPGGGIGPRP